MISNAVTSPCGSQTESVALVNKVVDNPLEQLPCTAAGPQTCSHKIEDWVLEVFKLIYVIAKNR